jgi:hypothetical protein
MEQLSLISLIRKKLKINTKIIRQQSKNKIKLKINAKNIIMLFLISFNWKKLKINTKMMRQLSINKI